MYGAIAALVLSVGLADMGMNHCPTGCLAAAPARGAWQLSGGAVIGHDGLPGGAELQIRRLGATRYGPFQPVVGASVTDLGDAWAGIGVAWTWSPGWGIHVQTSFMPGLHLRGQGRDMGHPLQFRTGIEIGWEAPSGRRIALAADHRSNADLAEINPGLDTVQLRITLPLD